MRKPTLNEVLELIDDEVHVSFGEYANVTGRKDEIRKWVTKGALAMEVQNIRVEGDRVLIDMEAHPF